MPTPPVFSYPQRTTATRYRVPFTGSPAQMVLEAPQSTLKPNWTGRLLGTQPFPATPLALGPGPWLPISLFQTLNSISPADPLNLASRGPEGLSPLSTCACLIAHTPSVSHVHSHLLVFAHPHSTQRCVRSCRSPQSASLQLSASPKT